MRKFGLINTFVLLTLTVIFAACQNYSSDDNADSAVLQPNENVVKSANTTAKYTVSFEVGSENYWIPKPIEVASGTKLTKEQLPILLSSIYEFNGWTAKQGDYSAKVEPGKYAVTSDITLYPLWKAIKYKLSYDTSGKITAPATVELNKKKILTSEHLPDISNDEYFLEGWYADVVTGDKTQRMKITAGEFSITSDTVLYAKFYHKYKVGDVVKLNDKPIGVIFQAATQTSPARGIALSENKDLAFSHADKRTEIIMKLISDSSGNGFEDGSKSWDIICEFDGQAADNPGSYPIFEFALNYADYFDCDGEKILKGSEYESGWYVGTIAEFKELYKNYTQIRNILKKLDDQTYKYSFKHYCYQTCNQVPHEAGKSYQAYMSYDGDKFAVEHQLKWQTYKVSGTVRPFRIFE